MPKMFARRRRRLGKAEMHKLMVENSAPSLCKYFSANIGCGSLCLAAALHRLTVMMIIMNDGG